MTRSAPRLLTVLAESIKASPELVQGTGANVSVKGGRFMWIKASGATLGEISGPRGHSVLRYGGLRKMYTRGEGEENEARKLIQRSLVTETRPSLEAGFHSFLHRYVIHLHPLYLNAILCSKNCRELLADAFPLEDYAVIPYRRVGHNLARGIADSRAGRDRDPEIYFLQNHGVVVASGSPKVCLKKTLELARRAKFFVVREAGAAPKYKGVEKARRNGIDGFAGTVLSRKSGFLFPDAAVFMTKLLGKGSLLPDGRAFYAMPKKAARLLDEVLYAHETIFSLADLLGGAAPLPRREVKALIGMEEEKRRQRAMEARRCR